MKHCALVAQLVEHQAAIREAVSLTPASLQHSGSLNCCLCNDNCKWLDFLDKDDGPSLTTPSMFITLLDVNKPTHYFQRVGH